MSPGFATPLPLLMFRTNSKMPTAKWSYVARKRTPSGGPTRGSKAARWDVEGAHLENRATTVLLVRLCTVGGGPLRRLLFGIVALDGPWSFGKLSRVTRGRRG